MNEFYILLRIVSILHWDGFLWELKVIAFHAKFPSPAVNIFELRLNWSAASGRRSYQLFILKGVYPSLNIVFFSFNSKYLFFAHVYEFGVILVLSWWLKRMDPSRKTMTKCPTAWHGLKETKCRQSENFTEFSLKASWKLLKSIKCFFSKYYCFCLADEIS